MVSGSFITRNVSSSTQIEIAIQLAQASFVHSPGPNKVLIGEEISTSHYSAKGIGQLKTEVFGKMKIAGDCF